MVRLLTRRSVQNVRQVTQCSSGYASNYYALFMRKLGTRALVIGIFIKWECTDHNVS